MILRSSRLQVEIAEPGVVYRGTRFDWSSLVRSVSLDGGPNRLSTELPPSGGESGGGFGLASEFGLRLAHGYRAAGWGGRFAKIGVGSLVRDWRRYRFHHQYTGLVEPIREIREEGSAGQDGHCLVIRQASAPDSAAAWRLERRWSATGSRLSCRITLENHGRLPIRTEEYCHNFFAPGGKGELCQEGLALKASGPFRRPFLKGVDPHEACQIKPDAIRFVRPSPSDIWFPDLCGKLPSPAWWECRDSAGLWVRETLEAPAEHVDIWAKDHVLSMELFVKLSILHGDSRSWTRHWDFEG